MEMTDVVFKKGDAVFLDPENVGSSVRWTVALSVTEPGVRPSGIPRDASVDLSGEVSLTDCTRAIHWQLGDFENEDAGEKKLVLAIKSLQAALSALHNARKLRAQKRKEFGITDKKED
jgi:hypothetical protein